MKKFIENKKLVFALLFVFVSAFAFADIRLEVPLNLVIGQTEIQKSNNHSLTSTSPFPLPISMPVRTTFVFPVNQKTSLGAGFSVNIYPFFLLTLNLANYYELLKINENSKLELETMIDCGFIYTPIDYFDVNQNKEIRKDTTVPVVQATVSVNWKSKYFYTGIGPSVMYFEDKTTRNFDYLINLIVGINFPVKLIKKN